MQSPDAPLDKVDSNVDAAKKILIKNIWLLMLYASDLYKHLNHPRIGAEENPEEIADLVAEVLCHHVEQRLKRNLNFGYQNKVEILNRVRGRIDLLYTESHRLLDKAKVCCRFEELIVDTPRNRYIRAALEHLSSLLKRLPSLRDKETLIHRCRRLAMHLARIGVGRGKPRGYSTRLERFGLHDSEDRIMLFAADFAFSLDLPTENGNYFLDSPDKKNKKWLEELFEKAVRGFYQMKLKKICVVKAEKLRWQTENESDNIKNILPTMNTDITITNKSGDRLIIDTKFNKITSRGYYRDETLRSEYIYQIYAYVMSQEGLDESKSHTTTGMLLHPSVGPDYDESVTIQGHKFIFCTVNLGDTATKIRDRLSDLLPLDFKPTD